MSESSRSALERDIDFVLVTGAGASCAFGVGGSRLPLMGDWSEDLVGRLAAKGGGYLPTTGLSKEMDGPQFEDQLGRFLRSVAAFNTIEPLLEPMTSFPLQGRQMVASGEWAEWHRQTRFHLEQITGVIHESLYGLFGAPTFDLRLAQQAYGALFAELAIGASSRFVYATTNYDTIGEEMIAALGRMPDVGDFQASPFSAERDIRVDRLLDGMPRYSPVLHLHGRVGWFRRPDGRVVSVPGHTYNASTGVPIVMLPDLEKDYATDSIINTLWGEFAEALRRAQRVLVLGHSLHDEALIEALIDNVIPPAALAVTFLPAPGESREPDGDEAAALRDRIGERLPDARAIPFRFDGATDTWTSALRDWSHQTRS